MPRPARTRQPMVQIPQATQDRLAKVARRHAASLMKRSGVVDVGIGYRYRDGKPTGELAVVVSVAKKVPLKRLAAKDRVPATVSGVGTDVVERTKVPLTSPHAYHDPLLGGISIKCHNGGGTLGCIVFDRRDARPYGLTNHHVTARFETEPKPWNVMQPSSSQARIGQFVRSDAATDSALFAVDEGRLGPRGLDTGILHSVSAPSRGTRSAVIGMPVQKAGATSAITYGVINSIGIVVRDFSIALDLMQPSGGYPFSAPGDSGSVVTERASGAVVGLLYAGSKTAPTIAQDEGWAFHIADVTEALHVFVYDSRQGVWTPDMAWIGGLHMAFAIVAPHQYAKLSVRYPSGRISTAEGLGRKRADRNGFVVWQWVVGTSTQRRPNTNCEVRVEVGGATRKAWFGLEGTTQYD